VHIRQGGVAVISLLFSLAQWTVALLFTLVCVATAQCNWFVLTRFAIQGRSGSMVPILGGLAGCLAVLIVPLDGAQRWWWLPLLLDIGCAPYFPLGITWLLVRKLKG
jgi:hypothetical protein